MTIWTFLRHFAALHDIYMDKVWRFVGFSAMFCSLLQLYVPSLCTKCGYLGPFCTLQLYMTFTWTKCGYSELVCSLLGPFAALHAIYMKKVQLFITILQAFCIFTSHLHGQSTAVWNFLAAFCNFTYHLCGQSVAIWNLFMAFYAFMYPIHSA